jgi:hypothetical protein
MEISEYIHRSAVLVFGGRKTMQLDVSLGGSRSNLDFVGRGEFILLQGIEFLLWSGLL